jgi:rfaE bifunctional protein kinase chain/domain
MSDRGRLLEIVDRFGDTTVALIGDLVLDRFILGTPKRISREAPVIILRWEAQRDVPGGGANALANLATLGVRVLPVAAVGDDEPGAALRSAIEGLGVDTSGIVTVPGFRTPTKVRLLGGGPSSLKHQVARYDIEDSLPDDAALAERIADSAAAAAAESTAVAVSDYGYGTVRPELVARIRAAVADRVCVCVDSRYRLCEFSGVDGATPNLQELEACAGHELDGDDAVAEAAEGLRRRLGAGFLLATRGNRGMTLAEQDREPLHIPVHGTDEVADVTGAGDTVLAVLTAALAAGGTPEHAARLANIAGGLVVMKLGTATLTPAELRDAVADAAGEP